MVPPKTLNRAGVWAALAIIALGASAIWASLIFSVFPLVNLHVNTTAADAKAVATACLAANRLPPTVLLSSNASSALVHAFNSAAVFHRGPMSSYLQDHEGRRHGHTLAEFTRADGPVKPYHWIVRCHRDLEQDEGEVSISPGGAVFAFDSAVPSQRQDHLLIYEDAAFKIVDAPFRVHVRIGGDRVVSFEPFFHVPPSYARRMRNLRYFNSTIAGLANAAYYAIIGLATTVGLRHLLRTRSLNVPFSLSTSAVLVTVHSAATLNHLEMLWIAKPSSVSSRSHLRSLVVKLASTALRTGLSVSAEVFSAAHASYPALPGFARVLELLPPSIVFGWLFLRFGLLPGILLHFYYDLILIALPVLSADPRVFWVSQLVICATIALPFTSCLIAPRLFKSGERRLILYRDLEPASQDVLAFLRLPTWIPPRLPAFDTRLRRAAVLGLVGGALLLALPNPTPQRFASVSRADVLDAP
ncbi:hypothetical protein HK405_015687 [Cladochytrium tenue]|nr:hypothetical protein HK405_015687 [Cladochytrium tenue]